MNDDDDPILRTREQPSLSRLIAVVGGVMGSFVLLFWAAQE
jgi:hypothetical protein